MISGATKIIAIFGNPVTHSLSPQMHNTWIADHGLDAAYVALPLDKEGAAETLRALKRVGLHGANVTVPFKEAARQAADACSPDAAALGVANTLVWKGGALQAHNTDWQGARRALDAAAPGWTDRVRRVALVGAGGAAWAMGYGLMRDGGRSVTVVNRTRSKAEDLAGFLSAYGAATARDWTELAEAIGEADLIVNAATLGMNDPEVRWPLERARQGAIVYDAVYAPLETALLAQARAHGLQTVDGLGMLIHQGALAFEIWFGISPDTGKARERLRKIIADRAV